ncbi:MAG: YmaF family protein [Eubacteriales bacterium]|nr:YmaF family protein [Eubacteriales bacterium]
MHTPMNIINLSPVKQHHVHEFLGSTFFAEEEEDRHNHRFAGVTCEAIPMEGGRHVHEYCTRTDFFENHYHNIHGKTGPDIQLPEGKHIHFGKAFTTVADGHKHMLEFATLIGPSPISD